MESRFKFWREKNIDLFVVRAQVGQLIAVMAEDGEDLDEAVKEAMANAGDEPATAATQDSAEDGKTTHTFENQLSSKIVGIKMVPNQETHVHVYVYAQQANQKRPHRPEVLRRGQR